MATANGGAKRLNLAPARSYEPSVAQSRFRPRHYAGMAAFVVMVILPVIVSSVYLFAVASDQYHSNLAFSVRSEERSSAAAGLLGAITQLSTGTASEADILFEFITSQTMIEAIDAKVDLKSIYRKPEHDPVFTLSEESTIEDLLDYWARMVDVTFENQAGIIRVRAKAFTPQDAMTVAAAILEESGTLVNRLSEESRQDAIRYSQLDLKDAETNLREQRRKLAEFRSEYRIMNPEADVAGQMGLLSALQTELAQALVDRDTLLSYVDQDDQRVVQAGRRIDAITARIEAERTSLGIGGIDVSVTEVLGRFEELATDLEFAAAAYTQALTNLALARTEARRQTRYLAVHIEPTLAEMSLYPQRYLLVGLIGGFMFLIWGFVMVFYYNIRDTR
ncbi:MAG: sugar transporter [Albidovulum sp.]